MFENDFPALQPDAPDPGEGHYLLQQVTVLPNRKYLKGLYYAHCVPTYFFYWLLVFVFQAKNVTHFEVTLTYKSINREK